MCIVRNLYFNYNFGIFGRKSNVFLRMFTEKERLLSPIQVIEILARSQSLNISNVKSYLMSILRAETKTTEDDVTHTDKFEHETNSIRNRVDKILSR